MVVYAFVIESTGSNGQCPSNCTKFFLDILFWEGHSPQNNTKNTFFKITFIINILHNRPLRLNDAFLYLQFFFFVVRSLNFRETIKNSIHQNAFILLSWRDNTKQNSFKMQPKEKMAEYMNMKSNVNFWLCAMLRWCLKIAWFINASFMPWYKSAFMQIE